jgi:hypothetical protein
LCPLDLTAPPDARVPLYSTKPTRAPLDLKRSSFRFHRELEPPLAFFRREWRTTAVCAGGFCLAMLAVVLLVDPAFFYPRLQTDPLNYILKTRHFLETGNTDAKWAVNLRPFAYVSMPGMLRLPAMAAFSEFDHQLRAIQIFNIPIVASVALLSAYIFSWALPREKHWMAIVFSFGFTLLSPVWVANVFLPLADAPYAVATMLAVVASVELLCSDKRSSRRPVLIGLLLLLVGLSFLLRYTAPVLLAFIAILAVARWDERGMSRRLKVGAAVLAGVFVLVLVVLNQHAITGRYLREPFVFLLKGDKFGMLMNLLGAAVPSQILPSFQLGFLHPPIQDTFQTKFSAATPDILWAAFGLAISFLVSAGMWISRRKMLPEIAYILAALPIITLLMPSTARYLMSYQAFLWIFFYTGAAWAAHRYAPWLVRLLRSRVAVLSAIALAAALVIGLRSWKVAGTASERYFAVTIERVPRYVHDVSTTFRSLRGFIETLPEDSTLLVGSRGNVGRWTAISGRDYYFPDKQLSRAVRDKQVYMVIECGTLEACQAWDIWKERAEARILRFGSFTFDPVFEAQSGWARAEVLRMRLAD